MTAHSRYGASGFSRIIPCVGSVRMSRDVPNLTNPAAELGTAAHELGEFCLRFGLNAYDCIGMTFNKHEVDAQMTDAVQLYVSFIRDIAHRSGVNPMIEVRVIMLSVGEDVFGTADCIFIIGDELHVYDYKHGYDLVEVQDNAQALFYAVATLDTYNQWSKINTVVTGIIQPRADHTDGAIRTATYSINELREWQKVFKDTVEKAKNPNAPLNAGKHCKYCLARGFCRPRIERTLDLIYSDKPFNRMNDDELIAIFHEVDSIKTNISAVENEVLSLARKGRTVDGYKLVNTISRAKCSDEEKFVDAAVESGIEREKLFNEKLISMTDAKKIIKNNDLVNQYFIKPAPSTTLVTMSNSRPAVAIKTNAVGVFDSVVNTTRPKASGIFGEIK